MTRVTRLVATAALMLAATLVALVLAEGAVRVVAPSWAPQHAERNFWRYDPLLGWAHREGVSGTLRHPDFEVAVEISEQGFRDRAYPEQRVSGRSRMLVLGDSFAWGFGVEREEILWEILEARHPDWEIINTAVSGYGTDQQLLFLERRGLDFRPDVVVLQLHPNDVEDAASERRYGYPKPSFQLDPEARLTLHGVPVPRLSWAWRVQRRLGQSSYLFNRLRALEPLFEPRAASVPVGAAGFMMGAAGAAPGAGERVDAGPDLALTHALLRRMASDCREDGIRFFVVSTPSPRELTDALARMLAGLGVPYRSLDGALRRRPREEVKFPHDPHWNARGHHIAADAVEEFLVEQSVLR